MHEDGQNGVSSTNYTIQRDKRNRSDFLSCQSESAMPKPNEVQHQ